MNPALDRFLDDSVPAKYRPMVMVLTTLIENVTPDLVLRMGDEYHKDMIVPVWGNIDDAIVLVPSKSGLIVEFVHGASFLDPFDLLQGQGRTARRLKLRHMTDFDQEALAFLIREAARLDADLVGGVS